MITKSAFYLILVYVVVVGVVSVFMSFQTHMVLEPSNKQIEMSNSKMADQLGIKAK